MPASDYTLETAIIAAAVTVVTAIVSAVIALRTNALSRENEHHLSILKVLLEAGYKEWELRARLENEKAQAKGEKPKFKSFTEYIIFYREMTKLYAQPNFTEEEMIEALKKNKTLIDAYYLNREIYRPEYHKNILFSKENDKKITP